MTNKHIPKMFVNDSVSVEEEIFQSREWDAARVASERRSRRLISEFRESVFPQRTDKNTQEMIDRAREYPLSSLIEIQRNKAARCVSGTHADNNASMDTRNNFAYCYACGWSGDVIAVYMKLNGVSFVEAVKNLQ